MMRFIPAKKTLEHRSVQRCEDENCHDNYQLAQRDNFSTKAIKLGWLEFIFTHLRHALH